ncbi:MAG: hypothetical protein FJY77_02480 [Candidatus Altiarchaeales archaeon]|nr:hypothetical protein [Candidatus Altiarchaeales archaeon]
MARNKKTVVKQLLSAIICDRPTTAAKLAHKLEMPLADVSGALVALKNDGLIREVEIEQLIDELK